MKKWAKEQGCYKGGGDVRLREFGCTVFKDSEVLDHEDADHESFSQQEAPGPTGPPRNEQESTEQSVYEAQADDHASSFSDECSIQH